MTEALVKPQATEELRRTPNPDSEATIYEFLGFEAGGEQFGLPLHSIREILKPPPLTPVPRTESHVLGIISVRGTVLTVTDLRRRLMVEETETTRQTRILLVDHEGETMGLLVDRVLQVFRLRDDQVEFATTLGGDFAEYVFGIGRPGKSRTDAQSVSNRESLLILLDLGSLLQW